MTLAGLQSLPERTERHRETEFRRDPARPSRSPRVSPYPHASSISLDNHLPIKISAIDHRPDRFEAPQHLRRWMTKGVPATGADDRDLRTPVFQQLGRSGRPAAVVRNLENAVPRRSQPRQNQALDVGAYVTEEQYGDVAIHHFEHDGVVVANTLPLPIRHGRMQHADPRAADDHLLTRLTSLNQCSALTSFAKHVMDRYTARNGNAFPHLSRREVINDRAGTTDVIGIAMCEQHRV